MRRAHRPTTSALHVGELDASVHRFCPAAPWTRNRHAAGQKRASGPHRPAPRAGLRDVSLRPGAFPPGAAAPGPRLRPLRGSRRSVAAAARTGEPVRGRKCLRSPRGGRRGRSGGGTRRGARLRSRARPAGRRAARVRARRGAHGAAPAGRASPAPAPRRGERGAPAGRCPRPRAGGAARLPVHAGPRPAQWPSSPAWP
jgi:hypothetical protein